MISYVLLCVFCSLILQIPIEQNHEFAKKQKHPAISSTSISTNVPSSCASLIGIHGQKGSNRDPVRTNKAFFLFLLNCFNVLLKLLWVLIIAKWLIHVSRHLAIFFGSFSELSKHRPNNDQIFAFNFFVVIL